MRNRRSLFGVVLPFLMLALVSLACDLEASMGQLTSEPQTFTATEGWEYDWSAEVTPGKEYEVSIATVDRSQPPVQAILHVVTEELCEECVFSADGLVLVDGLSTNFTATERGRVRISVYVLDGGSARCVIQIRAAG